MYPGRLVLEEGAAVLRTVAQVHSRETPGAVAALPGQVSPETQEHWLEPLDAKWDQRYQRARDGWIVESSVERPITALFTEAVVHNHKVVAP